MFHIIEEIDNQTKHKLQFLMFCFVGNLVEVWILLSTNK